MKKILWLTFLLISTSFVAKSQRLLSWTPEFPIDNSTLVTTVDCTKGNQGLLNFEGGNSANVYVHVGVITNLSTGPGDWRYVKFTWGTADPAAHATPLGNNKYQYTITNIRTFFGVPAGETIKKVCIIFRNATGSLKQVNSDVSDMYLPVYGSTEFAVRINMPPFEPRYIPWIEPISVAVGGSISVTGVSSANAALTLKLNGNTVGTATNANTITATPTISAACNQKVMLEGDDGSGVKKDSFEFYIPPTTTVAALPAGVQEGINYAANNTSATLVLYAPGKSSVVVIGDFTAWAVDCAYQMNKTPDGNYFWITVNNLTPGTEYGFQYLVDNSIKIADPYTQKVLDPDFDGGIDAVTYPNLKPYPTGLTTGIVSILQTAEPAYPWVVNNFSRPDKKNLMVYELLIRDFTAQHSYQSLIDSFQYFKNIGINAIELMPINEFTGNESWGYNPDFYFAPDKYYGTKSKLKEFIDKCHQNGIAVILDVVFNQCDNNAPEAKLYWNSATGQPAANNPWLNVTAPHPYSVFNDFNHTSTATQYLVQRSLNFWLDEYKVDGFRFDLAKGFTQTQSTTVTVENYDASRVANLKRYYDGTIQNHPNTYMILEFLGTLPCQEEQEYAAYGFMLWGNNNAVYNQCTMGYTSNSDISPIVYSDPKKAFNNPAEMGYMESHDEERTMYKNLTFGNANGSYNVKNLATALAREEAAASVFFTVPGPKMIWQFEERGYDISLTYGGSNVAPKPPHWEYMQDPNRKHLYDTYDSIINFRLNNPAIFNNTTFTYDFNNGGGLVKLFQIADPAANGKKVTVVANLDVVAQTKSVTFQSTGDWKNFISNGTGTGVNGATGTTFTLTAAAQSITLQPGEYHIYVSIPPCTTPAPTVTSPVNYCQNAAAVPLIATGTNLLWYTSATGGTGSTTAPTPSTAVTGTTTYYVSQTVGCESPRASITVNVSATTPAPTVTTPVNYCQNATATALTATGTSLLWYTTATGGTGSATAPVLSTTTVGSVTWYVSQTQSCGESPRASIVVNVNALPAAPVVTSPVVYCQGVTASALTATGTGLLWYTAATGGTGSSTAPTPSTTAAGSTTYYVSQTNSNGCEGPRASITVTVNATPTAPTVTSTITYCQNATAVALTATGNNLLWYTSATGGTGSATAPTPSTATAGSVIYYVSQTNASGCESPRASITVTVNALATAPTVTSPVTYCQNTSATALTATGTNLLWYTSTTGGTGSATAPVPSTATAGSTTWYVSQSNSCGESPRSSITVTITPTPAAPTGLTVTGISFNAAVLNWTAVTGNYYTVDYKTAASSAWINAATNITTGTVSLTNLTIGTAYNWRVSANCAASSAANYSTGQFSTTSHNSTITQIKNGLGIKISPNPVLDNAIVDYVVPANGQVTISLVDAIGRQLLTLYNGSQNSGQYVLLITNQLKTLNKGCYFLKLQQNGNSNFVQFIKQ
ncbi:MAG: T9SS type A sorting domain-containing protein [Bacteroidetes bacterium]|nr:T9SS type A sorting domain-containing protein [Bacteroidota bacterium]